MSNASVVQLLLMTSTGLLQVLVMPSGKLGTVRSIERDSCTCALARAGDNVAVSLQGIDWCHVMSGGVLCHPDFPVALATSLELKVLVLDIATPILIGSQVCEIGPSLLIIKAMLLI